MAILVRNSIFYIELPQPVAQEQCGFLTSTNKKIQNILYQFIETETGESDKRLDEAFNILFEEMTRTHNLPV